jgi:hypothetical protein
MPLMAQREVFCGCVRILPYIPLVGGGARSYCSENSSNENERSLVLSIWRLPSRVTKPTSNFQNRTPRHLVSDIYVSYL